MKRTKPIVKESFRELAKRRRECVHIFAWDHHIGKILCEKCGVEQ